jgi:hypothetical protein
MRSIKEKTIDSFNEYIGELKADGHDYTFSLVTFNSLKTELVFAGVPIETVLWDTISRQLTTGARR